MGLTSRAVVAASPTSIPVPPSRAAHAPFAGLSFPAFVADLGRTLAPASPLEQVLAERVILAAWRLHRASVEASAATLADEILPPLSQQQIRAERSLETSLELLETVRRAGAPRWGQTAPPAAKCNVTAVESEDFDDPAMDDADYSNEWPTLPGDEFDGDGDGDEDRDEDDEPVDTPRWQDRLVFDFDVSDRSPVVKGTWVTVSHVVSLIVDGWSWSDILRTHPELAEDDIRMCLTYTAEQDDRGEY